MNEDFIIEEGRLLGYIGNAKELIIPEGIKSIELGAFWIFKIKRKTVCGNVNFEKIYIPQSVEKIMVSADNLFMDYWQKLIEIKVSDDNRIYKSIDGNLYTKDGKKLIRYATQKKETVFVVPEGVSVIGEGAFACCENLTRITLPDSLTVIEKRGFEGCGNLAEIVMPTNLKKNIEIHDEAFLSCENLINFEFCEGISFIGSRVFEGCINLRKILIPKGVTKIEDRAFGCRDDWFSGFEKKQVVIFCEELMKPIGWDENWNSEDFFVVWGCQKQEIGEYIISNNMLYKIYDNQAILKQGNKNIDKTILIPARVKYKEIGREIKTIGEGAFKECSELYLLSFSCYNNIETIEANAFKNCHNLLFIEIPSSVKYMGSCVFNGCNNLTIYCQAPIKPEGWADNWNPDNRPVVWGYKL